MIDASPIRVIALHTYPIKSCAGLSHESIALDARGMIYDRRWMIVEDSDDHDLLTQRDLPRMALIQPSIAGDWLRLSAPDRTPFEVPLGEHGGRLLDLDVWGDSVVGLDEGDGVAGWLGDFLGLPVRLVRMHASRDRLVGEGFSDPPAPTSFADGYPMQIVSQASLDALNARLAVREKLPVPMSRFRPGVVVDGCAAFAEDGWRDIRIGTIPFDLIKPCIRCVMTTVDPATGTVPDTSEPLATLATFRRDGKGGVIFSHDMIPCGLGTLSVGDEVTIHLFKPT